MRNYSDKNKHVDAKIVDFVFDLFCSLLGVCLSAPFIYIGYNLFTNSTSGNRENAKLLKDKQFELRKVTGAVVAYSYPVNKQVEISLFCTQHLIGWI